MAERTEHLEAVLLSAVRPSQEQEKRFLAFLAEKYGEGTTLTWQKSDDYPDGFRLEVGAEVYDWSAGGRLSQFKDALEKLAATQGDVIPLLKETVLSWTPQAMAQEVGTVLTIGDGIARVDGLEGAAYGEVLLFDGGGEVAGRVLDGFDMLKLGKTVICFDADFQSGTAGHVIYDDRPLGHGIDGLVMADHAVLAGARVVRHNHEHRVGSRLLRLLDHAHGVRGIVRAGTGDHRDVHDFLDGPHQLDLLLHVGHGGFAGRAVHHQPVGAVGDQLLRQRLRGLEINRPVCFHGGDHCGEDASERSRVEKMHSTVTHISLPYLAARTHRRHPYII